MAEDKITFTVSDVKVANFYRLKEMARALNVSIQGKEEAELRKAVLDECKVKEVSPK